MGNRIGSSQNGLDAGYDIPLNVSTKRSVRETAYAAYCTAVKKDCRLMRETRLALSRLHRGLRRSFLTPLQKEKLAEEVRQGIENTNKRLEVASEACERLAREPDCPDSVELQLEVLERNGVYLLDLLHRVLCTIEKPARNPILLDWRRISTASDEYSVVSSQLYQETLYRAPDRQKISRTLLTEENAETAQEYFKVHDRLVRFVNPKHKMKFHIVSIEKIENRALDRRMLMAYSQLRKSCAPELLIHGTTEDRVEKIIREGFKLGTKGMYGAGIYFATDTTKSAQYSADSGVKSMLLCEVLLGRTMVMDGPKNDLNLDAVLAADCDSVFAKRNTKSTGGVLNDEFVIYRPEQATPRYLVKFTTV